MRSCCGIITTMMFRGLLPTWRDVDTIEDLLALIDETGLEAPCHGGSRVRPSPLAPSLSARTAGVVRLLASRLRARPSAAGAKTAGL